MSSREINLNLKHRKLLQTFTKRQLIVTFDNEAKHCIGTYTTPRHSPLTKGVTVSETSNRVNNKINILSRKRGVTAQEV